MKRPVAIAMMIFFLSGCGSSEPGPEETALAKAMEASDKNPDPLKAYADQAEAIKAAVSYSRRFDMLFKDEEKERLEALIYVANKDNMVRMVKFAESGNDEAIEWLYMRSSGWDAERSKVDAAPYVLERAKSQDASAIVLFLAGQLASEGKLVQQDYTQAISMLERAWLKGSEDAPGLLAGVYRSLGQHETAYLWAIRCVAYCDLDISLAKFVAEVPQVKVVEIQAQARERELLTL